MFAEVSRPLPCFRALMALTCWLVSDLRLLDRRFDTNHDGVLSFEEFCLVADAAIDGDRRLPPPTLTLYPPPAVKGPTVTPPEVSAQLRALLARSPAPVRLTTECSRFAVLADVECSFLRVCTHGAIGVCVNVDVCLCVGSVCMYSPVVVCVYVFMCVCLRVYGHPRPL